MSKIPGPQMGINEIVDAFTHKIIEENANKARYNPLRPSSSGKCETALGYEYMEYKGLASYPPDLKDPSVHRLLNFGNSVEYHANNELQAAFRQMESPIQLKYKQQSVTLFHLEHSGERIEGSIDLWLEAKDWRCIADWKSKGDKYSNYFKSSWDEFVEKMTKSGFAVSFGEHAIFITDLEKFIDAEVDVFFNDNLYQLNAYAHSDFIKERKPDFCSILQYNKNDSRIREVRFLPSETVFNRVREKFNRVAKTIDETGSTEGLKKEYVLGSMKCGFCRFKKQCWPENDALKDYFATLPKKYWSKDFDRLPKEAQEKLAPLFEEFHTYADIPKKVDKVERDIIKILDELKVYKIRLSKDQIYMVKRLKDGMVLRRSKD